MSPGGGYWGTCGDRIEAENEVMNGIRERDMLSYSYIRKGVMKL